MKQGRWLIWSIAVLCGLAALPSAPAYARERCFRIFDATVFRAKPDLSRHGVQRVEMVYGVRQLYLNETSPEKLARLPNRATVETTIKRLGVRDRAPLMIVDIEHWPNVGAEVGESVEKYVTLLDWIKGAAGGTPVGYYGVPPLRDYWRAIGMPVTGYQQWQVENDHFATLSAAVDVLAPSLYTFYDDVDGWKRYAIANVREAQRLAPGKPVYPFIWPQYHNSNRKLGGQYLPAEFWAQQLKTLAGIADGVVIWSGSPELWRPDAPWWQATLDFIASSDRACQPNSKS